MDDAGRLELVNILWGDLLEQLRIFLKKCGYHLEKKYIEQTGLNNSDRALTITELYYDKRAHRLQPRKRSVSRSSTLKIKLAEPQQYNITDSDFQAIEEIERSSREGADLSIYYSKNVGKLAINLEKQDRLFNDWNILHFHLGLERKQVTTGLMKRTKNVLMVYPTNEHLLFIDVRSHDPKDPEPWFDKAYVEIIHHDWPGFLASYSEPSIKSLSIRTTESAVKMLRGEGEEQKSAARQNNVPYTSAVVSAIQMDDGTVYHPPGEGMASNGMRAMSVRKSLHLMRQISIFAREIYNREEICHRVRQKLKMTINEPSVRLRVIGTTLWNCKIEFFEEKSGITLAECIL